MKWNYAGRKERAPNKKGQKARSRREWKDQRASEASPFILIAEWVIL